KPTAACRPARGAYDEAATRLLAAHVVYDSSPDMSSVECPMARIVRGGLIQATLCEPVTSPVEKIKQAMSDKHEAAIAKAADRGAQIICLQELFYGPYFCAEQQTKWYDLTERVPDGPTTKRFAELAKKHGVVLVLPVYEEEQTGLYY